MLKYWLENEKQKVLVCCNGQKILLKCFLTRISDSEIIQRCLTYHEPVAEEQLVKLASKRGKEAAEGGDQAAHDRRQPRRLPPAHRHRHWRDQE